MSTEDRQVGEKVVITLDAPMLLQMVKMEVDGLLSTRELASLVQADVRPGETWHDVAVRTGAISDQLNLGWLGRWRATDEGMHRTLTNILLLRIGAPDQVGRLLADPHRDKIYKVDFLGLRFLPIVDLTPSLRSRLLMFAEVHEAYLAAGGARLVKAQISPIPGEKLRIEKTALIDQTELQNNETSGPGQHGSQREGQGPSGFREE